MSRDPDLLCTCCKRPFSAVSSPPEASAVSRRAQRFCYDCQHQLPIDGCSFVECGKCSMQMLAIQLDSHLPQCRGMGDGPHAALHATQGRRCSHRQHLVPVTELLGGCSTCRYCRMRRAQPTSSAVTRPAKRARHSTTSAPSPSPADTHAAPAPMAITPVPGHAASSSSGISGSSSSAVSPAHTPVSPPPLGWSAVTTEVGAPPRTPSPPLYFGRPLPTPFASAPLPPLPPPAEHSAPTTPEPNPAPPTPNPDLPTRDELDSLFGSLGGMGSVPLGSAGSLGALAMGDQAVCSLLGHGTCPTQPSLSLGLPSMTWSLMHTVSTAGLGRLGSGGSRGSRGSQSLPRLSSRALTSRPSWDKCMEPTRAPPPPPSPAFFPPPPPPAFLLPPPPLSGFVFLEEPLPQLEEAASLNSLWDDLGWGEVDGEGLLPATITDLWSDIDSDDDDPLGSFFDLLHL